MHVPGLVQLHVQAMQMQGQVMANTGLDDSGEGYYVCPRCGHRVDGFDTEAQAKVALRLHMLGHMELK